MADNIIARMNCTIPRWRIRAVRVAIFVLEPFVRNEKTGARIAEALEAFVQRGLCVYMNGKRID